MGASNRVSHFFIDSAVSVKEGTKGKSPRLLENRNKLLCDRYYYHQKIKHFHYSKCVEELSNEFFLSQREITKIINRHTSYLHELRGAPPSIRLLKTRWPWMCWG